MGISCKWTPEHVLHKYLNVSMLSKEISRLYPPVPIFSYLFVINGMPFLRIKVNLDVKSLFWYQQIIRFF